MSLKKVYTRRIETNNDFTYIGEAEVGSEENEPVWRISRLYNSPVDAFTDLAISWAEGNSNFDKIWSNRETINYL